MRQALVTGATGGLGMALVAALLSRGYAVRATGRDVNAGRTYTGRGVSFVAAELTDPICAERLVAGMDVVFHAAALSSPWGRSETFRAVNVEATRRLLVAAQRAGCDSFVFISTPSVYSEPRDRVELTEQSPLAKRFANSYVETKYAAECLVRSSDAPGFATVALRPRALVGPNDRVLLPRLLRIARSGKFPLFRGGRALIELTDVRDAAEAAMAADEKRRSVGGMVFNISGGAPETARKTLGAVFAALELRTRFVESPYRLAAAVCAVAEFICSRLPGRPEPPATVSSLCTLAFSQTFDLTRAREQLGWSPRFSPKDAILYTAAHWKHHAPL